MAKGKKTGGRDFKVGDPRAGRPKTPLELKKASQLTIATARAKLNEFLSLDIGELETILREKIRPAIDLWVARIVLIGIKDGDERRLDFMLSRLIGPIPKEAPAVNINVNLDTMPKEKVIELGREAIKYLEEEDGDA